MRWTHSHAHLFVLSLLPSSFSDPFNVDVTRDVISLIRVALKNGVGYTKVLTPSTKDGEKLPLKQI